MRYRLLLLLLFIGSLIGNTQSVQAQAKIGEVDSLPTLRPVFRLNLVGPGIGLEAPANPYLSVYVEAGATFDQLVFLNLQGVPESKVIGIPYAALQFRCYYNVNRRQRLGKRVSYQSGNFCWDCCLLFFRYY